MFDSAVNECNTPVKSTTFIFIFKRQSFLVIMSLQLKAGSVLLTVSNVDVEKWSSIHLSLVAVQLILWLQLSFKARLTSNKYSAPSSALQWSRVSF